MEPNTNYVNVKDIIKYLVARWYVYIAIIVVAIIGCFLYERIDSNRSISEEESIDWKKIEEAKEYLENSFLQKIQPQEVHVKTLSYSIIIENANNTNYTMANALMFEIGAYSKGQEIFEKIEEEMQVSGVHLEEVIEVSVESNCMDIKIMGDNEETVETIADIMNREINGYYSLVEKKYNGLQLMRIYENYNVVIDEQLENVQKEKVRLQEEILKLEEDKQYSDRSVVSIYIFTVIAAMCLVTAILLLMYMYYKEKEVNK